MNHQVKWNDCDFIESKLPVTRAHVGPKDSVHAGHALIQTIDGWIDFRELAEPLRRTWRRRLLLLGSFGDSFATEENHRLDLWHLYVYGELEGLSTRSTVRRRGGLPRSHEAMPLNVPETQEQVLELRK
jgi:hypothetical protein